MKIKWFHWLVICCLLMSYINRGLFVTMPGSEFSTVAENSSNEINTLLELVLGWTDETNKNTIDEDGDNQEAYTFVKVQQPVFFHVTVQKIETEPLFFEENPQKAAPRSDTFYAFSFYLRIDRPPEYSSLARA